MSQMSAPAPLTAKLFSVAAAMPYVRDDMLFPSYRQPGLFLVRGMPPITMMCQLIGNVGDNAKGKQMPVHYSWRAGNVVWIPPEEILAQLGREPTT